jgi:hypothetical protein
MKNNNAIKPTLALRVDSISDLSAAELRVANGGSYSFSAAAPHFAVYDGRRG